MPRALHFMKVGEVVIKSIKCTTSATAKIQLINSIKVNGSVSEEAAVLFYFPSQWGQLLKEEFAPPGANSSL